MPFISFALSLDSIGCSTFPVHTYILTPRRMKMPCPIVRPWARRWRREAVCYAEDYGFEKRVESADYGDRRYLSRITSIGLTPGCNIEVLQNGKNRPLLIYGRDTMIALNRGESERIMVEVT